MKPKTGQRNRCNLCDSKYHLSLRSPRRVRVRTGNTHTSHRALFSSISFEEQGAANPEVARMDKEDTLCVGSVSIWVAPLAGFSVSQKDSEVVSDSGPGANLGHSK